MRFPIKQTVAVARHMAREKKLKTKRFPLVLMLEPLHACNLTCEGCGRIREYQDTVSRQVTLEACLKAADDCRAPVVSICGGEPLIYKDIKPLTEGLLQKGRVVYLCTNGTLLDKKLELFTPNKMFNFNIHLDGLERTHDLIVGKPGVFRQVIENIKLAKSKGFTVCTNTTIYQETSPEEVEDLMEQLRLLKVDGMLLSPSFSYTDVENKQVFLTREEINAKFKAISKFIKRYRSWSTPLYLDFLRGERAFKCTPWGNVTYNIKGWKAPCYLITDGHFDTYEDFIAGVDWDRYQEGRDPRCANCMLHSGFESTVALETASSWRDMARMAWWTLF